VIAAARTGSLAIVASALDSLLDLLAGAILWFTKWTMQHLNKYKYPIGKSRMQPVGIVVFAAIMATLGMQVLLTGVQELIEGNSSYSLDNRERIYLVAVMSTVILGKLGLFLYCRTFRSEIVQTYATVIDLFFVLTILTFN
jgi:divalent metal cation (Fe/Co/Zn/Cd) transporter